MHVDEILELENYFATSSVIIYSDEYWEEGFWKSNDPQVLSRIVY